MRDAFAEAWREIRSAVAWLIADALTPRPSADALLDGILQRLETSTASLTATLDRLGVPQPPHAAAAAEPTGDSPLAGPLAGTRKPGGSW
jgi:hypothetical protein